MLPYHMATNYCCESTKSLFNGKETMKIRQRAARCLKFNGVVGFLFCRISKREKIGMVIVYLELA